MEQRVIAQGPKILLDTPIDPPTSRSYMPISVTSSTVAVVFPFSFLSQIALQRVLADYDVVLCPYRTRAVVSEWLHNQTTFLCNVLLRA